MNSFIVSLIAKFINADTIGGYVRAAVAAGFSALLAWKGGFLMPFFTPEVQTVITAAITAFAVGLWAQVAKQTTAPTPVQAEKVAAIAVSAGVISPAVAAGVKTAVDESIK